MLKAGNMHPVALFNNYVKLRAKVIAGWLNEKRNRECDVEARRGV